MIITIFLTIIFIFMAFYSVSFIGSTFIRILFLLTYGLAIFFTWNKDLTNIIANFLGVQRGLDLIFIIFFVVITNGLFFITIHLLSQKKELTKLTRYLAIRDVYKPTREKQDDR